MAAITISFEVDSDRLGSYADEHLAQLWHIGQANPAVDADRKLSHFLV